MSIPADVQAVLDAMEPAIRDAFLACIAQIRSSAQMALLVDALKRGDIEAAVAALKIDPTFYAPLDRAISDAFYRGGVMALASLPRIPDPFPGAE